MYDMQNTALRLHSANDRDYKTIKSVYNEAFPPEERAPFFLIKKRARQGRATMLTAEQNGHFVGFAYTVVYQELVYLFYFAVEKSQRGNGNGRQILQLLKAYYPDKNIFLAREQLDAHADNSELRVRRRDFYLRCGFADQPLCIREASVQYDVMSTSGPISAPDYDTMMQNWAGRLVRRMIPMCMVPAQARE